jgi:hypothetical protein
LASVLLLGSGVLRAQDRDTKVRNDRESFERSKGWIYNDLEEGIRVAKAAGKPMLVVFRCIPCEACQRFDDDVARRDPILRDTMDKFVCVRIVQANRIDLRHFQFDFDQSFAVVLINPDLTVYGRYGTRSERPESDDISLQGLRKAMEAALGMHREYELCRPELADKQARPTRYATPRDYPSLAGKYQPTLDYQGKPARSCLHCHQVREAERRVYRDVGDAMPDKVLFPYPDPAVLGLAMDPKEMAKVERVSPGTPAARAAIEAGDEIVKLDGQPLLSVADLQWVLHNAPSAARLPAVVRRDARTLSLTLDLPEGWRRGNISWRATTWDLRRMAFGGMVLDDLTDEQRTRENLPKDRMALRVRHIGEFGEHAVAKRAGFRKDDVVVAFDGLRARMTESDLIAHAVQLRRPGDQVVVSILRDGETKSLSLTLP